LEPLGDRESLRAVAGDDPWLRWGVDLTPFPQAWHDALTGVTAVVRRRRVFGSSLVLLGPAEPVARTVPLLAPRTTADTLTVPRAAGDLLQREGTRHVAGDGAQWDWMWTTTSPDAVASAEVTPIDDSEPAVAQEISDLLARSSPTHSVEPGDPRVRRWVGVRDGGTLVACAAHYEAVEGVPLLASVAVDRAARGRGLGSTVTAWLTTSALASGAPAVTVDLYADNDVARRLYRRLGYRLAHEFTSWRLGSPA
jgi:ribosomal protein S18 acetylase RimI-like enzyme